MLELIIGCTLLVVTYFTLHGRTMVSLKKIVGFTLLELALVIIIIGSLAIFNSPAHERYLIKTKRTDAKKALVKLWYAQEAYKQSCSRYADTLGTRKTCVLGSTKAGNHELVFGTVSEKGYYNLKVIFADETGYLLQATPVRDNVQVNDVNCAKLTLDHMGNKRAYNSLNQATQECWKTKS